VEFVVGAFESYSKQEAFFWLTTYYPYSPTPTHYCKGISLDQRFSAFTGPYCGISIRTHITGNLTSCNKADYERVTFSTTSTSYLPTTSPYRRQSHRQFLPHLDTYVAAQ
jgi:hypothetical protein